SFVNGTPSTSTLSLSVTFVPSSVIIFPFTLTLPSVISSSALRREVTPLLAIAFCKRTSFVMLFLLEIIKEQIDLFLFFKFVLCRQVLQALQAEGLQKCFTGDKMCRPFVLQILF